MPNVPDLLSFGRDYGFILLADLSVAFVMVLALKGLAGLIAGVDPSRELAEKDNPAFGVSLAGSVVAVALMMTGVMEGEPAAGGVWEEAASVAAYGAAGIALMSAARFLFDAVSLQRISVKKLIGEGNLAAGIVDAGNVIASGIALRAVIVWTERYPVSPWLAIPAGYVLSQCVLAAVSFYSLRCRRREGCVQDMIASGNLAVAWNFAGLRVGAALAVTGASGAVHYSGASPLLHVAGAWLVLSFAAVALVLLLVRAADLVLLRGIDTAAETEGQRNVAVGAIQCALTVVMGLVIATLMQ
jgi:uncharacterized membrane protein YjfL (UPF0719 family)